MTQPIPPDRPRRRGKGRPPKRADLTTAMILTAVRDYRTGAHTALERAGWPHKVVAAALTRECTAGHLDWGCSPLLCWLTPQGHRRLEGTR